jgi:hypothetical protein
MTGGEIWSTAWHLAAGAGGGLVVAKLTGWLVRAVVARRRPRLAADIHDSCAAAWVTTLVVLGALSALPTAELVHGERNVRHLLVILAILAVAWLLARILLVVEDAAFTRIRVDVVDNRRARRLRTQISVVRRVTVAVIATIAVISVLLTFPVLRTLGTSLLASAGIVGIVAGLAAQTTLTNLIAGLQLAFTDQLRIDDVVVIEEEWGRVEEITLTHVVIHLWDERRLVLPTNWFTTQPFQNWTRSSSRLLGVVTLNLDFDTPVQLLREKTQEVIEASPLWDRRDWALQVTDATDTTMVVRVLASAADGPTAFDLRCDIREQLIDWLRTEHPEALPRTRATVISPERERDSIVAVPGMRDHRVPAATARPA